MMAGCGDALASHELQVRPEQLDLPFPLDGLQDSI
jgi:hypothetical protein